MVLPIDPNLFLSCFSNFVSKTLNNPSFSIYFIDFQLVNLVRPRNKSRGHIRALAQALCAQIHGPGVGLKDNAGGSVVISAVSCEVLFHYHRDNFYLQWLYIETYIIIV